MENLRELYFTNKSKDGSYLKWDMDKREYVKVSEEDMQYAKNIDKYRYLQDYYDFVRFDKDGNPLVKNYGEQCLHEPDIDLDNDDLHLEQYDRMSAHMSDIALTDPATFSLDDYINLYGEQYPLLTHSDFVMACEEIAGWAV